jgi:hypothetical protein
MRFQIIVMLTVLGHCCVGNAQWSSFRSVREELLPDDQRDIDNQTVEKGKVVPKEIRVDWYGFTLEDDTNVVEDIFQYPVADPTLFPGDKIIKVRTRDVRNADEITRELRATPERGTIALTVSREVDGQLKPVKISLHRANSLILKGIFADSIRVCPPLLNTEKADSWGAVFDFGCRVVAIADNDERIFSGAFVPLDGKSTRVENLVFRGWRIPDLDVGDELDLAERASDNGEEFQILKQKILLQSGSSGVPKQSADGGAGFLYAPDRRQLRGIRHIVGISKPEKIKVDAKDLEVHVVINMK